MSRTAIKNILANMVAFLLIYTIISGVYFLFFNEVSFVWWLMVIPFYLMQFSRARIKNVYTFIALHLLVLFGAFFINGFIFAFMIMAVVYSFIVRTVGERSLDIGIGVLMLILHTLFFVLAGQYAANPHIIQQQLVGTFILTLGLIIVHIHMDNIDSSLTIISHIDDRNYRSDKILSTNNTLITVFIVLVFAIGLTTIAFPLGRIISNPLSGLLQILQHRGHGNMTPSQVQRPIAEGTEVYTQNYAPYEEILPYDYHERPMWLMNLIYSVILLLVVAGVAFALYLFIRYFYRRHRKKGQSEDDNGDETILLTGNLLDDIRDLLPRFNRYSKNAIRRAYTKKVNWHIRRGVNVKMSDTTDIIANKIRNIEDIDELTATYEKVRYYK